MNAVNLGKKVLFVSFAITCALFISLKLLEATTVKPEPIGSQSHFPSLEKVVDNSFSKDLFSLTKSMFIKPSEPVAFHDSTVQRNIKFLPGSGKPIAYLLSKKLYVVDKNCSVLGLADSVQFMDLPIISANNPKINKKNYRLADENIKNAISLVRYMNKVNPILAARLSEVHIDPSYGLITYFDWAKGIYVVFGNGDVGKKMQNLESFYQELGKTKLIHQTKSLDLRYNGRIILKKNA